MLQFCPVNFGPGINEPELRLGKAAAQTLVCVHSEYGRLILLVGVEVRLMMLTARFDEHPNDDPEEARELGHARTLASSRFSSSG